MSIIAAGTKHDRVVAAGVRRFKISPWRIGSVALGLLLWWGIGVARPHVLSPPQAVVRAASSAASSGLLWSQTGITMYDLGLGLGIAMVIGIPFGIMMANYPTLRAVANMYLYWLFALPEVALIPFFIIALGYGLKARLFIVVLFALPVVAQRALVGASEVPIPLLEMAKSFELSRRQMVQRVTLPWAMPSIMTGIRLGFLRALIGVIAAGIFAQLFGLGGRIWQTEQNYQTAAMYMYIAVVAIIGLAGNALIGILDRRANWWAIAEDRK